MSATRSIRVQVSIQQKEAGSFSSNTLMSNEIVIPAALEGVKTLRVVGGLIESMLETVEIVHGPLQATDTEPITVEGSI